MTRPPSSAKAAAAPLVVGTGLVALDVVLSKAQPNNPRYWAGGTCGNVLTILRYLGWRSSPIARLRPGGATNRLLADLSRWGVGCEFVSVADDGSTPIIVQRIGRNAAGEPYHTFSWRCPNCGSRLPSYKPVLATEAATIASGLRKPRVFFLDRLSRGALVLAEAASEAGAAVVFEPSSVSSPAMFREAWAIADVVKYSHERLQELPEDLDSATGPNLLVETLGSEGLRYRARLRGSRIKWQRLDALEAPILRDAAGAGDWCTAGIIHKLFPRQSAVWDKLTDNALRNAIRYGQALAAWACGFEGARGGMYEVEHAQFERDVSAILTDGAASAIGTDRPDSTSAGITCLCPSCELPDRAARIVRKAVRRNVPLQVSSFASR